MMQKVIRTLLKDSIKIRNLSIYNTLQSHVNFSQGTFTHEVLENYEKDTNVENSLNLGNDPKNIIKYIKQNYKNIDAQNVIQVMHNLKTATMKDKTCLTVDLIHSKGFIHMCELIRKNIRSLSLYDIIQTLQILFYFNVPVNSMLTQTLLQLIRASLNELSVGQIITIHNMLTAQEKLPLIKSILDALPTVFKQQAQLELNADSNNLFRALNFAVIVKNQYMTCHIINILCYNKQLIKKENLIDTFYALCTLRKFNSISLKLLFKIKDKITTNCQSLSIKRIEFLLKCISNSVVTGKMEFYSDKMVDALCNAAVNHNITFNQSIPLLKYLNKMRHSNNILLDYLCSELLQNKDILEQCTINDVDHITESFIIADYKPPGWEDIQLLLINFMKHNDYFINNLVHVVLRLLLLGCYCPELVERTFIVYQNNHLKIINEQTTLNASKLHWCIKLFYPEYAGVMLNEDTLNNMFIYQKRVIDPSVLESLKEILGDVKYIMSNLRTKYGEFIEHLIVIQSNGLPMDISNYNIDDRYVEELNIPSECSKILFFVFPELAYSINKQNILSTVLLPLKAIETMKGYYTIIINPYLWKNFSRNGKVIYLQQAIKLKCSNADIQCYQS